MRQRGRDGMCVCCDGGSADGGMSGALGIGGGTIEEGRCLEWRCQKFGGRPEWILVGFRIRDEISRFPVAVTGLGVLDAINKDQGRCIPQVEIHIQHVVNCMMGCVEKSPLTYDLRRHVTDNAKRVI